MVIDFSLVLFRERIVDKNRSLLLKDAIDDLSVSLKDCEIVPLGFSRPAPIRGLSSLEKL